MNLQPTMDLLNYSPNLASQEIFGLFELDANGTVLYSRIRQNNRLINCNPDWIGQNYFEEIAQFENIQDLRRRFNNFLCGRHTTESFNFDCRIQGQIVPVKVMMAGAYEVGCDTPSNIVILDIRKF